MVVPKVKYIISSGRWSGSVIVTDFPLELRKPTPIMLPTRKIESRMESAAVSASLSAIAVFISKYVATVVTNSLQEMDGDPACPRIFLNQNSAMRALRWGGGVTDRNGNESADG